MRSVNLNSVALGQPLEVPGFRHRGTSIGRRLGAARIGAGVYEAVAELPIWPYHYHHGVEEWLYVISGTPVLREPAGERTLAAADLVCFPSGSRGAHTLKGPGRFVIFSAGHEDRPRLSVYPDSDKVSGPEGILLRSSAVDYWHGESPDVPPEPVQASRQPDPALRQPVVNLASHAVESDPETPPAFDARWAALGETLGSELMIASLYELAPGIRGAPYHFEVGREEWLLLLSGTALLRHPGGEDVLAAGDVVCFPEGPDGAHQLVGHGAAAVRYLILSTSGVPLTVHYPDSAKVLVNEGERGWKVYREADAVDYWEGEA